MRRVGIAIIILVVVAFVGVLYWLGDVKQRATEAQVERAAYTEFGKGPPIKCVAQDSNGATWNCSSFKRWGDTPACRGATVSVWGRITFSHETGYCE
jgi:hypothetical protein